MKTARKKTTALAVEYWPVERLKPYGRNPRKNDSVVPRMIESIKAYGFAIPVLAQSDGLVIDGHLRLKAALVMKLATVPVIACDGWSDAQVKAFRLMVNRSVTWADWDIERLALEFEELKSLSLTLTGFDPVEYGDMSKLVQFEYDENAADDVKYLDCPKCHYHFPV
jgi:ParB-like chromosome segregation protein Spo0J